MGPCVGDLLLCCCPDCNLLRTTWLLFVEAATNSKALVRTRARLVHVHHPVLSDDEGRCAAAPPPAAANAHSIH